MRAGVSTSVFLVLLACCSKDESPVSGEPAPGVSAGAATGTGAGAGTGTGAGADAGAGAGAHASAARDAPTGAGASDGVDPPLKAWMKANAARAVNARDFEGLAIALGKIATFAPPGYAYWSSIARDGVDAARVQDMDAVRGACRGCHSEYRDRYKRELRDRPIGT
jgi:hypothetical protein